MTLKQFERTKWVLALILGALMAMSITLKIYLIAVFSVLIAILLMLVLKHQVKEVLADERDYEISGKAAKWTMNIYCAFAVILAFTFLIARDFSPNFVLVGTTLAYSACALLLLYSLIFKYHQIENAKTKKIYLVFAIIIVLLAGIFSARFLSGEDDWICQNGQWIEHGHPSAPMPAIPCRR